MTTRRPAERSPEGHGLRAPAPRRRRSGGRRFARGCAAALVFCGCAGAGIAPVGATPPRSFSFPRDTVAYANGLVWRYVPMANGRYEARPRASHPAYTRYCFVVARTAKQFFNYARFEPDRPRPGLDALRRLVRRVVQSSPRRVAPAAAPVVIPGYASLRELSRAHGDLVKEEAGHWWQSYVQRGNWRMIFPFSRWHQAREARDLTDALDRGDPPIVHLVRFPSLAINHVVLLFDYTADETEIRFRAYDPNQPSAPRTLVFERESRTFRMAPTPYFAGGKLDVYRIYHGWIY